VIVLRSERVNWDQNESQRLPGKLRVDPGGLIEIHGLGRGYGWLGTVHRQTDWTDGCIAVTNEEIDEIWKLVPVGTPVEIRP
jgi:murein L,D-transpeptidase YafK